MTGPETSDSDVSATVSNAGSESESAQTDSTLSVVVDTSHAAATQESESARAAASVPSPEDDVRETHPGVYTSSGRNYDDSEQGDTAPVEDADGEIEMGTTNVVSSEAEDVESENQPASASAADDSYTASPESNVNETSSDSEKEPGEPESTEDAVDNEAGEYDGVESIPDTEFGEIDVDLIDANPRQPRTVFDEDLLAELVHSIREIGVLQPVVVRQKPSDRSRFELIMGERRLRATKDAGLPTIPAIIRYVEDTDLLRDALLENLHRAELNPLEEAAAYGQLLEDFGCTQEELSERIGRSRPQISNTLRLLRLPPLVQRRVAAGVISAGHARAILGLRDPEHMEVLAQRIVAEGLSVRASEEAVVLLNRGDSINVSRATTKVAPEFLAVAERLGDRLETKVNISVGKRKGKLSVEFANQEDLDRILGLLGVSNDEVI
ncbi:ParB/RepB/Spo0J family partition protein [Brevibacterium siliguriense]|uniref:ParB/RepB/Spo0J family partition protein n=1 Tax=Brevibacterium siliguriense TaxID=1136497 RepID=UPI001E2BA71C|nr:ParB/RepB/Spo0J family partition protein [Brevibacterium siliguriense]